MRAFRVMIQPISEDQTKLVMMTNVDPKLAYMPYTLLNWATKVLSYQMWSISFLPSPRTVVSVRV
jgi:hypothetical protein